MSLKDDIADTKAIVDVHSKMSEKLKEMKGVTYVVYRLPSGGNVCYVNFDQEMKKFYVNRSDMQFWTDEDKAIADLVYTVARYYVAKLNSNDTDTLPDTEEMTKIVVELRSNMLDFMVAGYVVK